MQLDQGGFDATEAFEEVGHSDAAIEFMKTLQIGVLDRQVRHTPHAKSRFEFHLTKLFS